MSSLRSYVQWAFALRGLAALIFGVVVLWKPGITIGVLVLLFGVYAIVSGLMSCFAAWAAPEHKGLFFVGGLFGIGVGILTLTHPRITLLALVYFVAILILIEGVVALMAAFAGGMGRDFNWVLALSGVVNVLFSVLLLVSPGAGAVTLVYVLGLYALLNGITLEVHAWQLGVGQPATVRIPAHA